MALETFRTFSLFIIGGILILMVLCRVLMLTQKDFTWRAAWFAAMFVAMLVLFTGRALDFSLGPMMAIYAFFIVTLGVCTFHEWKDFFTYLREGKGKKKPLEVVTLRDLAAPEPELAPVKPPATLEASAQITDPLPEHGPIKKELQT